MAKLTTIIALSVITGLAAAQGTRAQSFDEQVKKTSAQAKPAIEPTKNSLINYNLGYYISIGDLATMRSLMSKGADPNFVDQYKQTPLGIAVQYGKIESLKELIKAGADPNKASNHISDTPLLEAVKSYNIDIVQALLDAGANIEARNMHDESALLLAIERRSYEITPILLARGAQVNKWVCRGDATPLLAAVTRGQTGLVKMLIEAKADVDMADDDGVTPLGMAVFLKHQPIIDMLKAAGATNLGAD